MYYPCNVSQFDKDPGEIALLLAELREEHRDLFIRQPGAIPSLKRFNGMMQ